MDAWQSRLHSIQPRSDGWPGWTWKLPLLLLVLVLVPLILAILVVGLVALIAFFVMRGVFRLVALLFGAGPGMARTVAGGPGQDERQNVRVIIREED